MSTIVETEPGIRQNGAITPEELLAMPDGGHYELIDGELRERNVSALSNLIAGETCRVLGNHCREHDLGWIFAAEHGYRCLPWKPRQVRRADVSFIRKERYPWDKLSEDGYTTIAPDLVAGSFILNQGVAGKQIDGSFDLGACSYLPLSSQTCCQ